MFTFSFERNSAGSVEVRVHYRGETCDLIVAVVAVVVVVVVVDVVVVDVVVVVAVARVFPLRRPFFEKYIQGENNDCRT
tara:strand:+ start:179 stop:415 length:237 start_codon:yes stop_codon:yes gene_type:complete